MVVVTSLSSFRAMRKNGWAYDLPVFCVGAATARRARRMGFTRVTCSGDTVEELAGTLMRSRSGGRVLYPSGDSISTDLQSLLPVKRFRVRRVQLYASIHTDLDKDILNRLSQGEIEWISVFSRRTAEGLAAQLGDPSGAAWIRPCRVACLSEAVAEPLRGYGWKKVAVASRPTASGLIASLNECLEPRC